MTLAQSVAKRVSTFMKGTGFIQKKQCFYRIKNDIAFCVEFDSPSGLLYVTAYIIPLFIPSQNRYYSYGNRLNAIPHCNIPMLNRNSTPMEINHWCEVFSCVIKNRIIPFFDQVSSPLAILEFIEQRRSTVRGWMFCTDADLTRLILHLNFYLRKYQKMDSCFKDYINAVQNNKYMTESTRNLFLSDVTQIKHIISMESWQVDNYLKKVIATTTANCFN